MQELWFVLSIRTQNNRFRLRVSLGLGLRLGFGLGLGLANNRLTHCECKM